jgi:hypothetical protein
MTKVISASSIANGQSNHDDVHLSINITAVITTILEWIGSKIND